MQFEAQSRGIMYYLGPPLTGAVALFAIMAVKMLAKLPSIVRSPALLVQSLTVLAEATGAGCLAGVAYVLLGRPAQRVRVVGPYLAGIITIAAYLGCVLVVSQYSASPLIKKRSDLISYAVIIVFSGLFVGHSWFRKKVVSTHTVDPPAA